MTITGATRTFALLGRPVSASPSPALHGRWFADHGLDAVYVALEVPAGREADAIDAFRTLGLAGANVTVPLKEHAAAAVDALEGDAALAGAVNVLAWEGERLIGANTDARGLVAALEAEGASPAGRRAVVIGAGGAGRAAVVGLLNAGAASVVLANRTPERAERAARELGARIGGGRLSSAALPRLHLRDADLVVVASHTPPEGLDPSRCRPGTDWVDLGYRRPEPPTSAAARAAGCRVHDGTGMLVHQAALAFERWTGIRPDTGPALSRLRSQG